jgi:site-specific DNA recombinase
MNTLPTANDVLVDGELEAAIYPRVSSAAQEEGYSIESQQAAMLAKARELGWRIRRSNVFRETFTGEDLFERPQLTQLRASIARGDIQGVIFYDVDRFARDPVWIEMVTQECFHFGAQVAFVRGGDDLSLNTPEARVLRMLKGYAAKTEIDQIKERTSRGNRARLEAGRLRPSSAGPLYGYAFADAEAPDPGKRHPSPKVRYVIDEERAAVVRQIFGWGCAGWTIRAIAFELMRRGVPGPTHKGWSPEMIKKMLNDTSYYGEGYANKHQVVKVREGNRMVRRHVARPRAEWVRYPDGTVPPIIDLQTFDTAAQLRAANKRNASRNVAEPERFLLRGGFVFCGECGDRLYLHNTTAKRAQATQYWCNSRKHGLLHLPPEQRPPRRGHQVAIRADWLDADVWARVVDILDNPDHLNAEIERMRANDPTELDLASIDRSLVQVRRAIEGLTKGMAAVKTDDARAILAEQLDVAAEQRRQLQEERKQVLERRQGWLDAQRRMEDVKAWLAELRGAAEEMPYRLRRKVLVALDVRVTVHPRDHEPRWEMTASIPVDSPIVGTPTGSCTHNADESPATMKTPGALFLRWTNRDPLPSTTAA